MEKGEDSTAVLVYLCRVRDVCARRIACLSRVAPVFAKRSRRLIDKGTPSAQARGLCELTVGVLLAAVLGVVEDEQLVYGRYGKPALVAGSPRFNISHSDDLVVLALSDAELGIDVEPLPQKLTYHRVVTLGRALGIPHRRKADPAPELAARAATPVLWAHEWTRVEAILKGIGTGFSLETADYLPLMRKWCCAWEQVGNDVICVATHGKPVLSLVDFDVQSWIRT